MSSLMIVSRKEEPESLRTRRGFGFGGGSRGREDRISREEGEEEAAAEAEERTRRALARAGKKEEESLAPRWEDERDKSGEDGDGELEGCGSCVAV